MRVIDAYSVKPIDADGIRAAARATGGRVLTVEDHYDDGGLGDAVLNALVAETRVASTKIAVRDIPRSGKPEELLRTVRARCRVDRRQGARDRQARLIA